MSFQTMKVFSSNLFGLFFHQITFQDDNDFAKNNGNLGEGLELETLIGLKSIHFSRRELSFQTTKTKTRLLNKYSFPSILIYEQRISHERELIKCLYSVVTPHLYM